MVIMVVIMGHRDNHQSRTHLTLCQFIREIRIQAVACIALYSVLFSLAGSAELIPRLSVAQYYNDNVTLAAEGMEEHANITEIQPGVDYLHNGRKVDVQLNYQMQALYFAGTHDKDEVYHEATIDTDFILVPQNLFLEASANYSQQFISPDGAIDLDNLSSAENSTGVTTYRLSPYVRQRYGSFANAEYRVQQQKVKYDEQVSLDQSDSISNLSSIDITSGLAFDDLQWQLLLNHNKFKTDNVPDSTLRSGLLSTRYRIGPKFDLLADVGYEDNDFQYASGLEEPRGEIWNLGIGWNPSRRTRLTVKVGERFYGKTSSLIFNHRTRRTTWNIEYVEQLTTTPQLQQELRPTTIEVPTEEGEIIPVVVDVPYLVRASSVILSERLSLSARYESGKTILNLSLYNDKRQYQDLGQQEDSIGGSATWEWRFLSRTASQLSWTWYKIEYLASDRVDYLSQSELAIERQLRRTVVGRMGYRLLNRNSSDNLNEHERKLAFVSVRIEF